MANNLFIPLSAFAPNGFPINKCAVAWFAWRMGCVYAPILVSALANPSGYRVINAPLASARNSRLRQMANWINCATHIAKMASAKPAIIKTSCSLPSRSPPPLPPPYNMLLRKKSETSVTKPSNTTTVVITSVSRFLI